MSVIAWLKVIIDLVNKVKQAHILSRTWYILNENSLSYLWKWDKTGLKCKPEDLYDFNYRRKIYTPVGQNVDLIILCNSDHFKLIFTVTLFNHNWRHFHSLIRLLRFWNTFKTATCLYLMPLRSVSITWALQDPSLKKVLRTQNNENIITESQNGLGWKGH